MNKILPTLLILVLGCNSPDSKSVKYSNEVHLAGHGDYVGTLPDGRVIKRYAIDRGSLEHDHYIYVTILNQTIPQCKSSRNEVIGYVD